MRSRKQVVKTNKKRTNKKRFNKKRLNGGNPEFTVMTFNVECWLNQINPDNKTAFKQFMKGKSEKTPDKGEKTPDNWQQLKAIFNGVDIACIQENVVIKQADGSFKNFIKNIGDLNLKSSCESHDFHWPQTQGLYGVGSKISNSIYSKNNANNETVFTNTPIPAQLVKTTINTSGKPHPRCWAISTILIPVGVETRDGTNSNKKEVTVASIHLTGGRQDDTESLIRDNFIIKIQQMHELIQQRPSIICLDSNTKLPKNWSDIQNKSNPFLYTEFNGKKYEKYFLTDTTVSVKDFFEGGPDQLYLDETLKPKHRISLDRIYELIHAKLLGQLTKTELEDWTQITLMQRWYVWMYGLDRFMKGNGFKSIYDLDGLDIKDTTIYGGTVDGIYYKSNIIELKSVEFVDGVIDMDKPVDKFPDFGKRKILSDHCPVKAVFKII